MTFLAQAANAVLSLGCLVRERRSGATAANRRRYALVGDNVDATVEAELVAEIGFYLETFLGWFCHFVVLVCCVDYSPIIIYYRPKSTPFFNYSKVFFNSS